MTQRPPATCFLLMLVIAVMSVNAAASDTDAVSTKQAEANEVRLLSNIRQLIFEGRRSGEGYFSADGRRMIFQSERDEKNPFYQIFLLDLETGDVERVSPGHGKTTCGWIHPREQRVLFASSHEDPNAIEKQQAELDKRASGQGSRYSWSFDEHYDLFDADTHGGNLHNLTKTPGYDAEGSWSPDGQWIAFASNRHAYQTKLSAEEDKIFVNDKSYFMEIYLMKTDGSETRRLTQSPGYDGGPFFNAKGDRIVWRRFSADGTQAEIWTMKLDGSDQRQITRMGVMSWAPFFHPSGDYIIFANNAQGYGNFELYLVDTEGRREPVRVTSTAGFDGLPVFSPDGKQLSWTSSRTADKKPQIFVADWNDGVARELLQLTTLADSAEATAAHEMNPDLSSLSATIQTSDLRRHISFLASEKLAGRLTGTEGEQLAGKYVAAAFAQFGLQPAGDMGDWYQRFDFTSGVSLAEGNWLKINQRDATTSPALDTAWRPLSYSRLGNVEPAPVVFAGYGILAPSGEGYPAYDSYEGLDVSGNWVLAFRFMPEDISPQQRQFLNTYSGLRYKAMVARDKGAKGLILVAGPNAQVKDQLVKLRMEIAGGSMSLPVISVTDKVAGQLLADSGKTLQGLQSALDQGQAVNGFPLADTLVSADIRLRQEQGTGRNVLARLNAEDGPGNAVVVIGAHLDHIGRGADMDSLADAADSGKIHFGADDNASGVAALLEIAHRLAHDKQTGKVKLRQDIVFAAWSGEEIGRLGSTHFVNQFAAGKPGAEQFAPPVYAYLNMDMIGRMEQQLHLQGVGSSSVWPGEIERRNAPVGLAINTQNDSYLPTDSTSFYLAGVPVLSAFTGSHSDYNTPRDTPSRINYDGTARVARLMGLLTQSIASREQAPDYRLTEKPTSKASRANLRAYLGTIPDYAASDALGVALNGVAKGGPAEKAGLQAGDRILQVAGRKIENIYDFTHALNALKVGQPVQIRVERDGATIEIQAVPESRE